MKAIKLLLCVMILGLIAACAPQEPMAEPEAAPEGAAEEMAPEELPPIKIGMIGPLSGEVANLGEDQKAGIALAVQEINEAGGINGRQIEVIYEDGKCTGKDATTAASKLIEVDKVQFIVGGLCSSETLGAAPLAEKAGVVLLSPASSNPDITNAGDFIFRNWPSDAGQGVAMAEEIIKAGHSKVAVIYMNQDYNLGLANAFKENFEKLGGEITVWETYEQEAKDFRTQIAKIRASLPDAIYMVPYPVDGGLIIKQIKEMKMDHPLYGSETLGSPDTVEAAGEENIEGLVYATPKFDAEDPKAKDVLQKSQQLRGGDITFPAITANAYDAVYLIKAGLEGSPDQEPSGAIVRDYLYTVENWAGAGGTLTIDENGDAVKDFQIMYVHNGEFFPKEEPPVSETVAAAGEN